MCFIDQRIRPGPSENCHGHVLVCRRSPASPCLPGSVAETWPSVQWRPTRPCGTRTYPHPVGPTFLDCSPLRTGPGGRLHLACFEWLTRPSAACSVSRLTVSPFLDPQPCTPFWNHRVGRMCGGFHSSAQAPPSACSAFPSLALPGDIQASFKI